MQIIRDGKKLEAVGLIPLTDRTAVLDIVEGWGVGVWTEPINQDDYRDGIRNACLVAVDEEDRFVGKDVADLGYLWIPLDGLVGLIRREA